MPPESTTYFITVEWCSDEHRGIFCSRDGACFHKHGEPHTQEEMDNCLGLFTLILNPRSEPFTEEEVAEYTCFRPLAEYSNRYGIALKRAELEAKYELPDDGKTKESPGGEKS
jgi:hypothetical protein